MGLGIEDKLIKWDQIVVRKDEVKIPENVKVLNVFLLSLVFFHFTQNDRVTVVKE